MLLFERFPGIGPRQAQRFVQFLLRSSPSVRREMVDAIQELSTGVHQCSECMRFHAGARKLCGVCANAARNSQYLAVVATDADFAALERSGSFSGQYFILGGTISLASEKTNGLRIKQLLASLPERIKKGLKEVILAFPANPEGDATAAHVREEIKNHQGDALLVSSLGRGLSTGSELEYADPETLKSALENRK